MKQKGFYRLIALFAAYTALHLLDGSAATATTLKALSIDQLAARADAVVRGRVGGHSCEWRGRLIYTLTEVEVAEVLKGEVRQGKDEAPRKLRVVQLGGVVGKHAMPVPGVARLVPGEEVVLFLLRNAEAPGEFYLAGMSQGKLTVTGDERLVWAPTAVLWDGARLVAPTPRLMTMAELRRAVRGEPRGGQ